MNEVVWNSVEETRLKLRNSYSLHDHNSENMDATFDFVLLGIIILGFYFELDLCLFPELRWWQLNSLVLSLLESAVGRKRPQPVVFYPVHFDIDMVGPTNLAVVSRILVHFNAS